MITSIKKRDGRVVPFDSAKIDQAIARAFAASGSQKGEDTARELTRLVMEDLDKNENGRGKYWIHQENNYRKQECTPSLRKEWF